MGLYDNSVKVEKPFFRNYDISWTEQLDIKKDYYEKLGYKVIFCFYHNSFQDAAIPVLYDKKTVIPKQMQDYKGKYVKFNGRYVIEGQLGICDKCGNYAELIATCREGRFCRDCCEIDI